MDPGTVQQELLEREAELEAIVGAAERAAGGEGALVVIEAAAGMGKTRLLEAGCHAADERGVQLLRARGGELERDFAYGVVRQLLERRLLGSSAAERDALLKGAAELAGPAIGVDPQPQAGASTDLSFSVAHGLYWLVSNMTVRAPVMISVDDAHWADAPTLRFLLYLVARLEGLPLLVLVAARPGEPGTDTELLHRIAGAPGARVLKPGALSTDAVGELALRRLGAPSAPDFVQNAHRATAAIPFSFTSCSEHSRPTASPRTQRPLSGSPASGPRPSRGPCCCVSPGCRSLARDWRVPWPCSAREPTRPTLQHLRASTGSAWARRPMPSPLWRS